MNYLLPDRPTLDLTGPAWHEDAACAGIVDDATWFPVTKREAERALKEVRNVCGGCEVRTQCLEDAIANRLQGIWGGTDEKGRASIVRSRGRKSRSAA